MNEYKPNLKGTEGSEADKYFYGDYFNEFITIGWKLGDLKDPEFLEKVRSGKEKVIPSKIKTFFERYCGRFKEEDLSSDVLKKVRTLECIVDELNVIGRYKDELQEIKRIKELYDQAKKIVYTRDEKKEMEDN